MLKTIVELVSTVVVVVPEDEELEVEDIVEEVVLDDAVLVVPVDELGGVAALLGWTNMFTGPILPRMSLVILVRMLRARVPSCSVRRPPWACCTCMLSTLYRLAMRITAIPIARIISSSVKPDRGVATPAGSVQGVLP